MSFSRFILASTLFHLLLFTGAYFALKNTSEQKPQEIIARLITPQEEPRVEKPAPPKEPSPLKEIGKKPIPLPAKPVPAKPIPAEKRPNSLYEKEAPNTMKNIYEPPKPSPAPPPKTENATQQPKVPGVRNGAPHKEGTKGQAPIGNSKYQVKPSGPNLKDELFDKKIIDEQVAKSAGPHVPSPRDIISFSTREFRYIGYLARMKDKIESIWIYPREAAEKGISGDLLIKFTINKDGSLADAEVTRTSGNSMLDEAALKALKDGEPYWPLPKEWKENTFTIEGHFVYTLSGYYFIK